MFDTQQNNRRTRKVADQVKNDLSWIVQHKFKDPHKAMVTITRVKISPDLKYATAYFSVIGKDADHKETEKALKQSASFLRRELSQRIRLKFVPELRFFYDDSLEYADHMAQLFNRINDTNSDN